MELIKHTFKHENASNGINILTTDDGKGYFRCSQLAEILGYSSNKKSAKLHI